MSPARYRRGGQIAPDRERPLRRATETELRSRFEPIVGDGMNRVGPVHLYDGLAGRYAALPFATQPPLDVRDCLNQKGLYGLFTVLADPEHRIREDSAARTTELLVNVFGT